MKAGIELDALVAEKVMGVPKPPPPPPVSERRTQGDLMKPDPIHWVWVWSDESSIWGSHGWNPRPYSNHIADAWEVVEKVRASGVAITIHTYPPKKWVVRVTLPAPEASPHESMEGTSDSPAHAVCLAALKAVGHKIEE